MRKRLLLQRRPLTVVQVQSLETALAHCKLSSRDAAFTGFVLFMLHTRMRFSDAMSAMEEPRIVGTYVESATCEFKTANTTKRRRVPLPMAGCAQGLMGLGWSKLWLDLRAEEGLRVSSLCPLMPRPHSSRGWGSSRLSNSEANIWLKMVLRLACGDPGDLSDVGTHSCKAAALSWSAKAGLPVEDRLKLGSHVSKTSGSADMYARDALGAPLRTLLALYEKISSGEFNPDADRSGRWNVDPAKGPAEADVPESDSSDTDSDCSSGGEEVDAVSSALRKAQVLKGPGTAVPGVGRGNLADAETKSHCFHVKVHNSKTGQPVRMKCGRSSEFFTKVTEQVVILPKCANCFGLPKGTEPAIDSEPRGDKRLTPEGLGAVEDDGLLPKRIAR